MKDDYNTNSRLSHLCILSLKGWENGLFELRSERVKLASKSSSLVASWRFWILRPWIITALSGGSGVGWMGTGFPTHPWRTRSLSWSFTLARPRLLLWLFLDCVRYLWYWGRGRWGGFVNFSIALETSGEQIEKRSEFRKFQPSFVKRKFGRTALF